MLECIIASWREKEWGVQRNQFFLNNSNFIIISCCWPTRSFQFSVSSLINLSFMFHLSLDSLMNIEIPTQYFRSFQLSQILSLSIVPTLKHCFLIYLFIRILFTSKFYIYTFFVLHFLIQCKLLTCSCLQLPFYYQYQTDQYFIYFNVYIAMEHWPSFQNKYSKIFYGLSIFVNSSSFCSH